MAASGAALVIGSIGRTARAEKARTTVGKRFSTLLRGGRVYLRPVAARPAIEDEGRAGRPAAAGTQPVAAPPADHPVGQRLFTVRADGGLTRRHRNVAGVDVGHGVPPFAGWLLVPRSPPAKAIGHSSVRSGTPSAPDSGIPPRAASEVEAHGPRLRIVCRPDMRG
jgi:hypothetical protein